MPLIHGVHCLLLQVAIQILFIFLLLRLTCNSGQSLWTKWYYNVSL